MPTKRGNFAADRPIEQRQAGAKSISERTLTARTASLSADRCGSRPLIPATHRMWAL